MPPSSAGDVPEITGEVRLKNPKTVMFIISAGGKVPDILWAKIANCETRVSGEILSGSVPEIPPYIVLLAVSTRLS
jgi:hypothetical protein